MLKQPPYASNETVRHCGGLAADIQWEVTEMINRRASMEDAWAFCPSLPSHPSLYAAAVMDGHGGDAVAKHLAASLLERLDALEQPMDKAQIRELFHRCDREILATDDLKSQGSCAVLLLGQVHSGRLLVANVGDCRAAALDQGATQPRFITRDHKTSDEVERKRVTEAGFMHIDPYVVHPTTGEGIMVTRAFGDAMFKDRTDLDPNEQALTCDPTFTETKLAPGALLMLLSDGLLGALKADWKLERGPDTHSLHVLLAKRVLESRVDDNVTLLTLEPPSAHLRPEPPTEPSAKRIKECA
jgi:serine/threonine protein phosphatase PrpC